MTQFQINVQIGLTPELTAVLLPLVAKLQIEMQPVAAPAQKKPRAAKQQPVVENPEPQQETAPAAEPAEPQQEQPAPAADPEPVKEKAGAEKREYTEVDVRAAMDALRKRIEGEDYKDNPDSEGYKKWHRQLTAWFKNTAAVCGAEKPSALPDSDSRAAFIKECDEVIVENDRLTTQCPF